MPIRVGVELAPVKGHAGASRRVEVFCGAGEQVLRWLSFAALTRMAYELGDTPGKYVPQGVLSSNGVVFDPDTVLNEVLEDGDNVAVEYSSGPQAFTKRWEGRPLTRILRYDDDGTLEILPDDFWIQEMNLTLYGVDKQLEGNLKGEDRIRDLESTKEELLKNAGPLQVVFNYYETRSDEDTTGMGLMNMQDYRIFTQECGFCSDGSHFTATRADDLFNETLKSVQAAETELGLKSTGRSLSFKGYLILVLGIANEKFAMDISPSKKPKENFKTGNSPPAVSFMELHVKLNYLCENYLFPSVFPPLQKSYDRFKITMTPGTHFLLERGRKLIRNTLDSCQLRRVAGEPMNVSFKHLSGHVQKWGFLHTKLNMQDLHLIMEWAKRGDIALAESRVTQLPISIDYVEFERFLCAMCYSCYIGEGTQIPFEEFFGDCLDIIFKKSGVLS